MPARGAWKRGRSCRGPPGPGKAEGSDGVEPSPCRREALDSVPALLLTSRVTPGSRPRPLLSASSSLEWPVPASESWREANISKGFSTAPGCTAHVNKGRRIHTYVHTCVHVCVYICVLYRSGYLDIFTNLGNVYIGLYRYRHKHKQCIYRPIQTKLDTHTYIRYLLADVGM